MLVKIKGKPSLPFKQNMKGRRILVEDIGSKVVLFNGKNYFRLTVNENMVGYYFLDFVFPKVLGNAIHVKKKSKKKNKK